MIIVDSNIIIQCFNNNRALPKGELVVPDDLNDEYEIAKEIHGKDIPGMVLASQLPDYDESYYLKKYYYYLNSYPEVYFVQMRGFGDVAILALAACLVENFGHPKQQTLFDFDPNSSEIIAIATHDGPLRRKIESEFANQVRIMRYEDI